MSGPIDPTWPTPGLRNWASLMNTELDVVVDGVNAKVDTTRQVAAGTGLSGGGDLSADRTLAVTADTTVQRIRVSKAGSLVGTRRELNVVEGSNVTMTAADDPGNNRVNLTINASGGGSADAWVFNVKSYGAVGNGSTDDTAAINSAVTAAVAYAQAHAPPYAEVYFPAGVYNLSSATTQGGATKGNAQIPLPVVDSAVTKVTLVFRGAHDATALPHWLQAVPQQWGVTLNSTLTGLSPTAWGAPSVIGGPTPQGGYGSGSPAIFNNMLVVIDGIGIAAPLNPSIIAFDFRGMAEAAIPNAAAIASATPTQMNATTLTNSWATGLFMPQNLNNDLCEIGSFSCEGFYFGVSVTEHTTARRIAAIYCNTAVYVSIDAWGHHSPWLGYVSVEVCQYGVWCDGSAGTIVGVSIDMLDCEAIGSEHIHDPNNSMGGIVHFADNNIVNPTVNGAANLEIISTRRSRGPVSAPGVPGSTTALQNPFWRHAAVSVAGGTVSAIAIDSTATGLTSGTVIVPSGHSITLTYSGSPSWSWVLM